MVMYKNFLKVHFEFSVQSMTKIFLIVNHYKLFMDKPKVSTFPVGCFKRFFI